MSKFWRLARLPKHDPSVADTGTAPVCQAYGARTVSLIRIVEFVRSAAESNRQPFSRDSFQNCLLTASRTLRRALDRSRTCLQPVRSGRPIR